MRSLVPLSLALLVLTAAAQTPSTPNSPNQIANPQPTTSTSPAAKTTETATTEPYDPVMDVPPLPKGKATLVGGTVRKIDRLRNRVTVEAFGGHSMKIGFDERTHIYRDGAETTQLGIQPGDRVYVDTLLDKTQVFAKNIRVVTALTPANANGQLIGYDPRTGMVAMRDRLSKQPVRFQVGQNTVITRMDKPGSVSDLQPNALVAVKFAPGGANRGTATEIAIVAPPGQAFQFAGTITHLDFKSGIVAINNHTDDKTYDINFTPGLFRDSGMALGKEANIVAVFEGTGYRAQTIKVVEQPAANPDAYKDQQK